MAVQTSPLENEACRPSSWPIRNQRRHAAAVTFQTKMLETVSSISERLQSIERHLKHVHGLTGPPPGLAGDNPDVSPRRDIDSRMDRVEKLLFRMGFEEYEHLDKNIDAATTLGADRPPEPEKEASPSTCPNTAFFSIFDSQVDKISQTDEQVNPRMVEKIIQTEPLEIERADKTDAITYANLTGEWIPISDLIVNDVVKVVTPFLDSTTGVRINLAVDMFGKVLKVDEEGDAEIRFPALEQLYPRERNRWVLATCFGNMVKHGTKHSPRQKSDARTG